MPGTLSTSKTKLIRQIAPVPVSVTWAPPWGVKRSCPKAGSISVTSNTIPAHSVPASPTPVGATCTTFGSAPVGAQTENDPSTPHDGINVIPGSPLGQGAGSPELQTVLTSAVLGVVF